MTCRVAIIGLGMVAKLHVQAINSLNGFEVYGLFSRDYLKTQDFAKNFATKAKTFKKFEDLCGDESIDLVLLLTPPNARFDYVHALAKVGKPVIVEKPLERNFERSQNIVEQGKIHRSPIGVFLQHRKRPSIEVLKTLIDEGRVGAVATVEVRIPWWRGQDYYDQDGRGTLSRDGGGVLITQAIHTLDIMLLLCGPVKEVQGMIYTSSLHKLEAEDFSGALLNFQSGARGTLMASTTHFPGFKEEIILNCSKATVNINGADLKIFYHDGKIEHLESGSQTGSGSDPMDFSYAWHAGVLDQFWNEFTSKQEIQISAESALPVHRLIDAIIHSSELGKKVTI
mgnify:FL=1